MASEKYNEASKNLIRAIDIAIEMFRKFPPKNLEPKQVEHIISVYIENKNLVINAEPKYQTLASLKYDIENVFIFFQETSGEAVNEFWKKIKEEGLPYERENRMEKLLKRGRIRNQIEYDYVIDTIVALQQEGVLSNADVEHLNKMIDHYESKRK